MPVFEKVEVEWKGQKYTLPPSRVVRCIADVEDVLTLAQLSRYLAMGNPPLGKLSMAFAILLQHAGARVSDDEVYNVLFKDDVENERAVQCIYALQVLMIPPEHLRTAEAKLRAAGAMTEPASSPTSTGS